MSNSLESLDKLVKTVYSDWLENTYGISKSPVKLEGCDLIKYRLRFKIVQKEYEPMFNIC